MKPNENIESQIEYELEQEILYSAIEENINKEEKENKKKKYRKGSIKNKVKSGLQIKTVLLLLITLLVNTYAWFIYLTSVDTKIDMHINEWKFELQDGESQGFTMVVDEIYPGMPVAEKNIIAQNKDGSMAADLSCEITRLKVLDEEYIRGEKKVDAVDDTDVYTSDDLLNKMINDYPFKIKIYIDDKEFTGSNDVLTMVGGEETNIKLEVTWPYEVGNVVDGVAEGDEVDTEWGIKAYDYLTNSENPEKYSVQVEIVIKAVQHEGSNNP